ncbi:general stress protein [Paenisporosarcina sp.]|uniref:general stress protein n=1 Tax=Paenisporosarcina sp. TaxID=1932001 RepID=UPI003C788CD3
MNKRVVGIYNSEEAVMLEIDKLKSLGHNENSIFVLAQDYTRASAIAQQTGVQLEDIPEEGNMEPQGTGIFSKVFFALDYDTQHSGVASVLKSAGVTEDEVGLYVRKIEQGDMVVLANENAPHQPYSDESDAGYANEEQSMQYYETAMTAENGHVSSRSESRRFVDYDQTSHMYEQNQQQSLDPVQDELVPGHQTASQGAVTSFSPLKKDEVYVEHIYFDSFTAPIETDDEELIRVPIIEERVKVIKEKVVTGEIVVRRRTT